MQVLQETTSILATIQSLSTKLLKEVSLHARKLVRDDNEMVENLLAEFSNLDSKQAVGFLKEAIKELTSDARSIREEIDSFASALANNTPVLDLEDAPFMSEVWLGDAYNSSGLSALKELEMELRSQYENVSYDLIYEKAKELIGE